MAEITAQKVNELRNKTGLPMMKCKQLLTAAGGDVFGRAAGSRDVDLAAVAALGRDARGVFAAGRGGAAAVVRELADAVIEGKQGRADKPDDASTGPGPQGRRRSSRSAFRADEAGAPGAPRPGEESSTQVDIPPTGGPVETVPGPEPVAAGQSA